MMDTDQPIMNAGIYEILDDVCLYLGLEPPVAGQPLVGGSDYEIIVKRITIETRRLLARGWWFNTTIDYEFEPDAQGNIAPLPALKVEVNRYQERDYHPNVALRPSQDSADQTLWNLDENSDEFDKPFKATVIWNIPLDELPDEAKRYIAASVAVRMAMVYGVQPPEHEMARADHDLKTSNANSGHTYNFYKDNPINYRTTWRNP